MKFRVLFAAAFAASTFVAQANASAVQTIDFESFRNGGAVRSATSDGGVTADLITFANLRGGGTRRIFARAFDTNNSSNSDLDLQSPIRRLSTGEVTDLGNALIIPDSLRPLSDSGRGGTIQFDFGQAVTFNSIDNINAVEGNGLAEIKLNGAATA